MILVRRWITALLTASIILVGAGARSDNGAAATEQPFSKDQIEQMVAPIALYPDSLVAQILMASTYPLDIVQAARWSKENPDLEGAELEEALASHNWDPSVKALTNFPDVLARMNENLDWTQDLGDAVLANQQDVMDSIQEMRRYAKDAGNLKTTEEQKVVVEEKVIIIEPATEVVYVPAYNPVVVYGSYWSPVHYHYPIYRYPPSYWYPPGYVASNIISFGIGMAVGAAIWGNWGWGHCNWRGSKIEINNNFNFKKNINTRDINIGNKGRGRFSGWEHNAKNRRGVRYRDDRTREKYSGRTRDLKDRSRVDRDAARGFDRSNRVGKDRPASRDLTRDRPTTRDLEKSLGQAKDRARPATRDLDGVKARDRAAPGDRAASRDRPSTRDRVDTRDKAATRDRVATRDKATTRDRAATRDRPATTDRRPSGGSVSRPADRSASRPSSAFKSQGSGSFERRASQRGGQSRSASRNRGGGRAGGGRAGGGGLKR